MQILRPESAASHQELSYLLFISIQMVSICDDLYLLFIDISWVGRRVYVSELHFWFSYKVIFGGATVFSKLLISMALRSTFTVKENAEIILKLKNGENNADLCKEYKFSHSTISTIWKTAIKYFFYLFI